MGSSQSPLRSRLVLGQVEARATLSFQLDRIDLLLDRESVLLTEKLEVLFGRVLQRRGHVDLETTKEINWKEEKQTRFC